MISLEDSLNATTAEIYLEQLEKGFLNDSQGGRKEISSSTTTGAVSDLFDQNVLTHIENCFAHSTLGHYILSAEHFITLITQYIPYHLVDNIYRSIDVNDVGYVRYADFTNYLIASEAGFSFTTKNFIAKLVLSFTQDDHLLGINHRDAIDCLVHVKRPCPMIITGGRDGQLSLWDPETLHLIKTIDHRDKNSIYMEELNKQMNTMMKAQTKRLLEHAPNAKPAKVAITAICPMFQWGMLCVGSADCSMTLYELGNQDVCGRYTAMEFIPTAIECFQRHSDSKGHLHIIMLDEEFGSSIEVGMKKKNQLLFNDAIEHHTIVLKHLQHDWITQIRYVIEINSLVCASMDCTIIFVDVERWTVTKTFHGHAKSFHGTTPSTTTTTVSSSSSSSALGISTFSWSSFSKYIVSGSDRVLLYWDPFTMDIMSRNDSLTSPIITVEVHDSHNKVFAALLNKSIMLWHNITFELLQVISDTTVYKPVNTLASMTFIPDRNLLYTAGNRLTLWTLERSAEGIDQYEEEDLVGVLYNTRFNQVILVRSLGTVKIYQTETGEIRRQFLARPMDPHTMQIQTPKKDSSGLYQPLISYATLDKNQTRLIVYGCDHSVHFWNIHDGSNLIQFVPQLFPTSLINQLGRGHHQQQHSQHQHSRHSSQVGSISIYHEHQATIESIPTSFLRLLDEDDGSTDSFSKVLMNQMIANNNNDANMKEKKSSVLAHLVRKLIDDGHTNNGSSNNGSNNEDDVVVSTSQQGSGQGSGSGSGQQGSGSGGNRSSSSPSRRRVLPDSNHLLVSYSSGRLVIWDLLTDRKLGELSVNSYGAILSGMKMKNKMKKSQQWIQYLVDYL
eukprot:gene1258-1371_t